MHLSIANSIAAVPAVDWDQLAGGTNPFVRHAFLLALEQTGCANTPAGWTPCHLLVHAQAPGEGALIGAAPMYLKSHSYGEYVFDWAWADAYERARLRYYPKLVAAVPFTPATGARLLAAAQDQARIRQFLINGALTLAREAHVSSLHWLFIRPEELEPLVHAGHLRRTGYQFHWHNEGYRSFEQFLMELASSKRKKLKQERRYVREAGIAIEVVVGDMIKPAHWQTFYQFYLSTIRNHGAIPYLKREFFYALGDTMKQDIVLIFARHNGDLIAGALNLRGSDTLYGRYWGANKYVNGLHFEVCYYAAMEYCIEHGLRRFEAGAQGQHKLARGFLPVATYSAHWLKHAQFGRAVEDFLQEEQHGLEYHMDELNEHSPFKSNRQTDAASAWRR
jgi:predicted N-acyltransferase